MKVTPEMVGQNIRWIYAKPDDVVEILFVGNHYFFGRKTNGAEHIYLLEQENFVSCEEKK